MNVLLLVALGIVLYLTIGFVVLHFARKLPEDWRPEGDGEEGMFFLLWPSPVLIGIVAGLYLGLFKICALVGRFLHQK